MSSSYPLPVVGLIVLCALGASVGCSSDAEDVFGESSGSGPSSGSGDGGGAVTTTTSGGPTTSTGDGGAGPVTSSSSDGGGTTTGDGGGPVTTVGPTSTAAGPTCGDGVINGDELCDGDELGGQTCGSLGTPGNGELACVDCAFDTSGCVKCGNGTLDPGEDCDDGGTATEDGCDANCHFEGQTCQSAIDLTLGLGDTVTIATTNADGAAAPDACLDASGPGRVLRVVPEARGFLTAWVRRDGTTFDTSLRMGSSCNAETIVCADSYGTDAGNQPPGGEVGSLRVEEGVPTFVFIEGWNDDEVGDFTVEIALARGRCDDPVVVPVEPGSDDGIVLWGLNGGTGNDEVGDCGFQNGAGNGEEATYELLSVGGGSPVDVELTPVQGYLYNPVLHARVGTCDEVDDEIDCSAQAGFGSAENLEDLSIAQGAFVHADAAQGSTGGYRMRVIPPAP